MVEDPIDEPEWQLTDEELDFYLKVEDELELLNSPKSLETYSRPFPAPKNFNRSSNLTYARNLILRRYSKRDLCVHQKGEVVVRDEEREERKHKWRCMELEAMRDE